MLHLLANAKLNLALDIVGRRENGYHDLQMILQSVSLADRVSLAPAGAIRVACSNAALAEGNLAEAAARAFFAAAGIHGGVDIFIQKQIPVAAGLGGGSADAAAVLVGLNRLWENPLSMEQLGALALPLGADVPFCLAGGTALAAGVGEVLTPLAPLPDCGILLVKPCQKPSTGQMYRAVDQVPRPIHPDVQRVAAGLAAGDLAGIAASLGNSFAAAWEATPSMAQARADLWETHPLGVALSGSGPTLFALYESLPAAEQAAAALAGRYDQMWTAIPRPAGVEALA